MNKIEDILENLLKEFPELAENKEDIKNLLHTMEQNDPDIVIDSDFRNTLKNKLEIQNYAKLKNTQNKKINIADKWVMSFKKDWESIFEKPKFNFLKLLAPALIWCFGVFWFFHFFWGSLFSVQDWWELEYTPTKIQESSSTQIAPLEMKSIMQSDSWLLQWKEKDQNNNGWNNADEDTLQLDEIADQINIEEELEVKKAEVKSSIAERIRQKNAEKSLQREVQKEKVEDDFTKSLRAEMQVEPKEETLIVAKEENSVDENVSVPVMKTLEWDSSDITQIVSPELNVVNWEKKSWEVVSETILSDVEWVVNNVTPNIEQTTVIPDLSNANVAEVITEDTTTEDTTTEDTTTEDTTTEDTSTENISTETTINANIETSSALMTTEVIVEWEPSINTEIVDMLWENLEKVEIWNEEITSWTWSNSDENQAEEATFEQLCEDRWWEVRWEFCHYWSSVCKKQDYESGFCLQ